MANTSKIVALMIGVLIASVLFLPLFDTVNANSGVQTVNNSTVTVQNDTYTDLSGYEVDRSTVVVYGYNETSGNYVQATSDDYDLNPTPGEIKANNSSTLIQDGEEIKVTYDYAATSPLTTTVVTLVPLFAAVAIVAVLGIRIQGMM